MVNKLYARGRAKEYYIRNKLLKLGCDIAFRSAGSHSPIDVVGIDKKRRRIVLFQCKTGVLSPNARIKLLNEQRELNDTYQVEFDVI